MKHVMAFMIVLVVSLCFGYDAVADEAPTPNKELTERATQRWAALIAQDFNRAYEFETPGFRQVNPASKYRNFYGSAVTWKNFQITKVEPSPDHLRAKVSIIVEYDGPKPAGGVYQGQISIEETWIWVDDQWSYIRNIK